MRSHLPGRADLVDAGFLTALFSLALLGFRTTFTGWAFLGVGLAGLVLGLVVGHVAVRTRHPVVAAGFLAVVVFFLLGGVVAAREQVVAGVLPTPGSVARLAELLVHAWMLLLTTLPPVDGAGPLLVIPYVLGLMCGAGGLTLARRVGASAAPVAVPLAVLLAVVLLGTGLESSGVPGVAFAVVALAWSGLRGRRQGRRVQAGRSGRSSAGLRRAVTACVLLGVAGGAVALVGGALPAPAHRVVLRDYVRPPVEVGVYASPLVGFRRYTKDANQLWDQTLFTVEGLPAGQRVRIAVLDDYDGSVWAATNDLTGADALLRNGFQRVGARIPTTGDGEEVEVTVTVGAAFASAEEVSAWLPTVGRPTRVSFTGDRAAAHTEHLRYNLATTSAIVGDRLRADDRYTVHAVLQSEELPPDVQPHGRPAVDPADLAFVRSKVAQWVGGASTTGDKLRAVAAHLRDNGAYTDGGPGESEYLPGHGLARLSRFFNADKPAGNDEQYAAAYALVANQLGVPARVVLGATPGADGVVRGEHVHAWAEIHVADGRWLPVTDFMPDRSKRPDRQPPQQVENTDASIVPPPNAVRTPDSLTDADQVDANTGRRVVDGGGFQLPAWLVAVLAWGSPPVLAVAAVVGAITGLKARRRTRRRTTGPTARRLARGWRELVDHARDLGARVPTGTTRLEEAEHLVLAANTWTAQPAGPATTPVQQQFRDLARAADSLVFGPGDPAEAAVADFWARVDQARRGMGRSVGRWRRWRGAVNPRSLRGGLR
ncbi:DUF3488 and transglutaminase-like domain-containing protein [Saccharothrix yanglingensis]|uniref:Transglutaminase-like domain-containing protein n=1 Tax=Saccharothrix yanglingensis TaxID=659496 RepID=A0ABU0X5I8_9PSEU|nr:transglutaminase domain-containing protein [Saccharothrix yanglingensis]MDQ2587292.1 hypothetical protein [Saccharothrix yanglingensis]